MSVVIRRAYNAAAAAAALKPLNAQSPHHSGDSSALASQISRLLSSAFSCRATWDAVRAHLKSLPRPLSPSLVERVLLDLKDPHNARTALLFFHCSARYSASPHSLRTYCIAIHVLARAGLLRYADALIESAITKAADSPPSLLQTLISTYDEAQSTPKVFDLLIRSYSKKRMVGEAVGACNFLRDRWLSPDLNTFRILLHVAQKTGHYLLAWKVYEFMLMRRVYPDQGIIETMVNLMCREGTLRKMVTVLDRINGQRCGPAIVVNAALGLQMMEDGRAEEAVLLMKRMLQKNMIIDVTMYSLVIYAHCKAGRMDLAHDVKKEMINRGCGSNAFVYTSFIGAHCKKGEIIEASRLLEEMCMKGLKPYDATYCYLIERFSNMRNVDACMGFYERMVHEGFLPDLCTCNEMLGMLCEAGQAKRADGVLTHLLNTGFVPNEMTYLKLVDGYAKIEKAHEIVKLYYEVEHRGVETSQNFYSFLSQKLCQLGKSTEAKKLLVNIRRKQLPA